MENKNESESEYEMYKAQYKKLKAKQEDWQLKYDELKAENERLKEMNDEQKAEKKLAFANYQKLYAEHAALKDRAQKLSAEHADLNLALAAMLNGYQNLCLHNKDWFSVPPDLINEYTKMVLEYNTREEEANNSIKQICMSCGKDVYGPEPKMCCDGRECSCNGQPIEPVVCSQECYDKVVNRGKEGKV